jgi:hypothetical protein
MVYMPSKACGAATEHIINPVVPTVLAVLAVTYTLAASAP